jgi:hypothetical protein
MNLIVTSVWFRSTAGAAISRPRPPLSGGSRGTGAEIDILVDFFRLGRGTVADRPAPGRGARDPS